MKFKGSFKSKDILTLDQFNRSSLLKLFKKTDAIVRSIHRNKQSSILKGRIIALLFFEPSTRTFNSFSSAVQRLGGGVISLQNIATTSIVKGESFEDSIKTIESYADAIVIRHPEVGSAQKAADTALIPVINAGDGGNQHPTQTFLDLYTIYKHFGRLNNLKFVICGDPLHSRSIRSLVQSLSLFYKNTIYLLSPEELKLSRDLYNKLKQSGLKLFEITSEKEIPKDADVWYWNRIQKERFKSIKEYRQSMGKFTISKNLLKKRGNKNMIILDPLPRVEEINPEVDADPRAYYFQQAKNGLYVRMALLKLVLGTI